MMMMRLNSLSWARLIPVRKAVRRLYPNKEQMVMVMMGRTTTVKSKRMMNGSRMFPPCALRLSESPIATKKMTPKNSLRDLTLLIIST